MKEKLHKRRKPTLGAALITIMLLCAGIRDAQAQEQTIHDRMFHSRAVEAVVWAMPLLNFKGYRDGHASVGVGYNDIAYHSKIQNWKFQTATPNNTTPYVNCYWSIKDGPMVVEIPPSADGVGIFGTIMDAWQRPLDDVGAAGRDTAHLAHQVFGAIGITLEGPAFQRSRRVQQLATAGGGDLLREQVLVHLEAAMGAA